MSSTHLLTQAKSATASISSAASHGQVIASEDVSIALLPSNSNSSIDRMFLKVRVRSRSIAEGIETAITVNAAPLESDIHSALEMNVDATVSVHDVDVIEANEEPAPAPPPSVLLSPPPSPSQPPEEDESPSLNPSARIPTALPPPPSSLQDTPTETRSLMLVFRVTSEDDSLYGDDDAANVVAALQSLFGVSQENIHVIFLRSPSLPTRRRARTLQSAATGWITMVRILW